MELLILKQKLVADLYLITGGNLGNRLEYLQKAKKLIGKYIGIIIKHSSIYETEPWGFDHSNKFLNQVLFLQTEKDPYHVLDDIQNIENKIGRKRSGKVYEARIIDIDILFYNNLIISGTKLNIPHKHFENRKFSLVPMFEIAPNFEHPVLNKSIEELLAGCMDNSQVTTFKEST